MMSNYIFPGAIRRPAPPPGTLAHTDYGDGSFFIGRYFKLTAEMAATTIFSPSLSALLQLKAVKALLDKTTLELLDGTYRKAMAEKIALAHQNCPGDCGNEAAIEWLRRLFPDIPLEEVPERLNEAEALDERLKKYLSKKNLDTPLPGE